MAQKPIGVHPSHTRGRICPSASIPPRLDALADARMNAVFFQVRAESDAFYPSALEPWSRFLTGKQGQDPGWDPLAFAIEEGHKRGIEIHAWMNRVPRLREHADRGRAHTCHEAARVGCAPVRQSAVDGPRRVAIYRLGSGGEHVIERLVPVTTSASGAQFDVALEPGKWALATIDRRGVKSRAAPVVIP